MHSHFFVYSGHAGNGFRRIDDPDCQAFSRSHTANGFRHQGYTQTGAGPLQTRSGVIIAAERVCSGPIFWKAMDMMASKRR